MSHKMNCFLLRSLLLVLWISAQTEALQSYTLPTTLRTRYIPTRRVNSAIFGKKKRSNEHPSKARKISQQQIDDKDDKPLVQTLGGGSSLIFEMARRMLVWEDESSSAANKKPPGVLPRWHPHAGISDVNPSFRTQSPLMNNQGYAGTIWRNVRKRDKPSLWRYSLRMYNRMKLLEEESKTPLVIERSNVHHEGALLACAKLGLWQEALQIYRHVEETATTNQTVVATTRRRKAVCVTDNMLLSLVSACVHGSKNLRGEETSLEERRAPLDAAVEVLLEIEDKHGLPLVARHLNPLASAYQKLGLLSDAANLLQNHLTERTSGPEEENGDDPFNVNDVRAKDKASYSLLVKGSVSTGDWADAVEALKEMTEAGLYPNARNLNSWTEVSEGKSKQASSWKKKREEYWLESVR